MFKNHLITLKDADMELLETALADEELEESKRAAMASQEGGVSQAGIKGDKAAAKGKDAKAPAKGKGAADTNVNAPKQIEIEYPEVDSEPDFILIEKTFVEGKKSATAAKRAQTAKSMISSVVGGA